MSSTVSTQIQLAARPVGWPTAADFATAQVEFGELGPDQLRVVNEYISVDPYMRGRMSDAKSYAAPFEVGETMTGGAIGRVVESTSATIPVGAVVLHQFGWRDVVQENASGFKVVPELPGAPLSLYLGILGMTGLTAFVGLTAIAGMKPGDTVFISGAAGAVGTAAGQIARLLGAGRVIGSAGSDAKASLLKDKYGYDAAFNYKSGPVREQLAAAAPEGIDVFFDNVGGDHLEAALDVFNPGGRAALCGAIAGYNTTERKAGPDNMANLITRGLSLKGFTLGSYLDLAPEFNKRMAGWFAAGDIAFDETVMDGIENAVAAFLAMMHGANTGKMVVRTAPSSELKG